MELQKLKEVINKAGFPADALEKMNKILDAATARGSIEQEEKDKLLAILDFEIENETLHADMLEELASALGAFTNEYDDAEELLSDELDAIESEVDEALVDKKPAESQPEKTEPAQTPPAEPVREEAQVKEKDNTEISKIRESLQQAATSSNDEPSKPEPLPPVPPPFPSTPPQS